MSGIYQPNPYDIEYPDPEPCPRCSEAGSEPGTDEPCAACEGTGWV